MPYLHPELLAKLEEDVAEAVATVRDIPEGKVTLGLTLTIERRQSDGEIGADYKLKNTFATTGGWSIAFYEQPALDFEQANEERLEFLRAKIAEDAGFLAAEAEAKALLERQQ